MSTSLFRNANEKDGMPMSNFTPAWIKKGFFNESIFCDDFLSTHQLLYVNGAFFTCSTFVDCAA